MTLNDSGASGDKVNVPMNPPDTSLGLRHLIAIAVLTPVLMAAGVVWLRSQPIGAAPQTTDAVIEVTLTPQEASRQLQQAIPQPQSPTMQPDPTIDNEVRSIPQGSSIEKPEETTTLEPTEPAQKPQARKPETRSHVRADQEALAFQRMLLSHIARFRRYPEDAQRNGVRGTAVVVFSMRRDGTVASVWIRTTSGNIQLDTAAVDTIRRAVPLPHIPSELPDSLNVLIPVAFNLP